MTENSGDQKRWQFSLAKAAWLLLLVCVYFALLLPFLRDEMPLAAILLHAGIGGASGWLFGRWSGAVVGLIIGEAAGWIVVSALDLMDLQLAVLMAVGSVFGAVWGLGYFRWWTLCLGIVAGSLLAPLLSSLLLVRL